VWQGDTELYARALNAVRLRLLAVTGQTFGLDSAVGRTLHLVRYPACCFCFHI
jgi:hypothetical protein